MSECITDVWCWCKKMQIFLGRGHSPLPITPTQWGGGHNLPTPTPSILTPPILKFCPRYCPWLYENHTRAPEHGDTSWKRHEEHRQTIERHQWVEAASDWNVVSNQQSFIDQAIDQWQDCFIACLRVKSKHWTFAIIFLRNFHDF